MTSSRVTIREHRIPSADAKPYIAVEGPDGALWFCESGAAKIGRFDPDRATFTEFALAAKTATPIGIAAGADGNLWFCEKAVNRIGRITPRGEIAEFHTPLALCRPGRHRARPRRQCVVLRVRDQQDRPHHAGRRDHRIRRRHQRSARGRCRSWCATARCGFPKPPATASAASPSDGKVTEFPIPSHDSQPRAMAAHPDGSIWFVETSTNALGRIDRDGRITEHKVPTPNSSLRGVAVGADGDLWYTANAANKIGRMAPDGSVRGEYDIPTPQSGARCITALRRRPPVLHPIRRRADRGSGDRLIRSGAAAAGTSMLRCRPATPS